MIRAWNEFTVRWSESPSPFVEPFEDSSRSAK